MSPRGRPRLLEIVTRLALAGAGVAAGLLVAELGVRWLRPQRSWYWTPPGPFVVVGPGEYELLPGYRGESSNRIEYTNQVTINSSGMRGREIGPKDEERCRILVIGDSFTFGIGVEDDETYPVLLDGLLADEVINGGVSAMGVPHEVRWLERHGLAVNPDVVVLATYMGNDFQDAMSQWANREVVYGRLYQKKERSALKEWLFLNSQLYVLLKESVPTPVQGWVRARLGLGEPWSVQRLRSSFSFFAEELSETELEGVENTAAALDELVDLAAEHGVELAALTIPDAMQAADGPWEETVRQLGVDPSDYDRDAPTRRMLELLAERGIPARDLTEPFRRGTARGETLYWPVDRHWTPLGHELAAARVAEFLEGLGFRCREADSRASS
jgi:hypothetical protein